MQQHSEDLLRQPACKIWHITVRPTRPGDAGTTRTYFATSAPMVEDVISLMTPCDGVEGHVVRIEPRVGNPNVFLVDIEVIANAESGCVASSRAVRSDDGE